MNKSSKKKLNLKLFFLFLFLLFLARTNSSKAMINYYVRADAVGLGDGSDWENAFNSLPQALIRGAVYYIADGVYSGYVFDDAENGNEYIYIKKATNQEYGSEIGWEEEYGDGKAVFQVDVSAALSKVGWVFLKGYYDINGTIGGGSKNWTAGHGFKMSSSNEKDIFIMLSDKFGVWGSRPNVSHISISHAELDGQKAVAGYGIGIQSNAYNTTVSDIHLSYLYVHDISGFADFRGNPSDILIEYSEFSRNATSSDHHGVGIRIDYLSGNFVYRYNRMSNVVGTGWIGHYTGDVDDGDGAEFYGNVFFATDDQNEMSGWAPIFSDSASGVPVVDNWKIYNNTFYGFPVHKKLVEIDTPSSANIQAYNNLAYDLGADGTNFINVDDQQNNVTILNNPFFDIKLYNFALNIAVGKGKELDYPYDIDVLENFRGADGVWDRGAYEFVEEVQTLLADFDSDSDVDIFDYNILLANFGTTGDCGNPADADGDCNVGIFDYNILLGEFGSGT